MVRLALIVAVLAGATARAGEEPGAPKGRAEDWASKAYEMVGKGQYNEAVALYLKAYQLTPTPAILYNLAVIHDKRLQEREVALDYYRRYLRSSEVDPELAKRAGERVEAIKDELTRREARPVALVPNAAGAPAPRAAAPSASATLREKASEQPKASGGLSDLKIASLVVGGAGLVAAGVGLGFGAHARSLNDEALQYCAGKSCWDPRGVPLTNDAKSSATVSTLLVTLGGAAAIGGAAVFLLAPSGDRPQAARPITLVPVASAHGAGVLLRGEL